MTETRNLLWLQVRAGRQALIVHHDFGTLTPVLPSGVWSLLGLSDNGFAPFSLLSPLHLMKRVGEALNFERGSDGRLLGDRNLFDMLSNRFKEDFKRHHDAAIDLSEVVQEFQFDSIDEALHWFSSNPKIVEIACKGILSAP